MRKGAKHGSQASDVVTVGQAIYNERIRDTLGPEFKGKLVVIDVESGDYEIDLRQADATRRLLQRRPGAITYTERIGYPTAYTLGFRSAAHTSD